MGREGLAVVVGARTKEQVEAVATEVRGAGGEAVAVELDVTDPVSVEAAVAIAAALGPLDVLVNNAGIARAAGSARKFEDVVRSGKPGAASLDEVRAVFETNVFGVIAVTQAMLPLLREAPAGRIVNVSSSSGSLTLNADPAFPYRSVFGIYSASKTALNAITLALAMELEPTRIKVNAACPGFTSTDLNNFAGTRTVEQAAREPVRLALLGPDGPTGTFSDENGPIPW